MNLGISPSQVSQIPPKCNQPTFCSRNCVSKAVSNSLKKNKSSGLKLFLASALGTLAYCGFTTSKTKSKFHDDLNNTSLYIMIEALSREEAKGLPKDKIIKNLGWKEKTYNYIQEKRAEVDKSFNKLLPGARATYYSSLYSSDLTQEEYSNILNAKRGDVVKPNHGYLEASDDSDSLDPDVYCNLIIDNTNRVPVSSDFRSDGSLFGKEEHVLFPRGTQFKVISNMEDSGKRIIILEPLPPEKNFIVNA